MKENIITINSKCLENFKTFLEVLKKNAQISHSNFSKLKMVNDWHIGQKMQLAYSSTDSFLASIPVSDWLIFCCGNLILYKKRNENDKNKFFDEKQQKKCKNVYENRELHCLL